MGWDGLFGWLWPRSGTLFRPERRIPPLPARRAPVQVGSRVILRIPIASPHTVHIAAGVAGIVVGGDARAKQARVELDAPRTLITVPWNWLEDEPPPAADAAPEASPAAEPRAP